MKKLFVLFALLNIVSCKEDEPKTINEAILNPYANESFARYWDRGKAELTSYDLEQYRYGQKRAGEAVLIFVTEDFSKSKQVKLGNPSAAGEDAVHVLKLNFTKKFITGIYPYSMMRSSFFPLNGETEPIKVTTSSQEWCGHTFTQLNSTASGYAGQLLSYFESEGDKEFNVAGGVVLEDGIWNMIRIAPEQLPVGEVSMLPGTLYQRLSHKKPQPVAATCSLSAADSNGTRIYKIEYASLNRALSIHFEKDFPHRIIGWEELYPGFNSNEELATKATMRAQIKLDYWRHNNNADSIWRDSLKVQY